MTNTSEPEMSGRPLRIAVVARRAPIPIFTGINLVVHHIAAGIAAGSQVRLLLTDDDPVPASVLLPFEVVACGRSGYGDGGAAAADETENYRSRLAKFYGVPLRREEWLERAVEQFDPDVVLGFGYDLAAYLQPLAQRWPVVFNPIDSEVLYLWRRLRSAGLRFATLKHLLASSLLARLVLSRFSSLITVSDEDTESLRLVTGVKRLATVPNGVDCQFFSPQAGILPVPGRVIFSGSMSWPPNAQAVEWFLAKCWGRILQVRPDATLVLVGKGMSDAQRDAYSRYANVQALGFVDDIREHMLAAEVSIAPMISGSGIKNKVLESWAMNRPVVATTLAARGLNAKPRLHILTAENHQEFADAVLEVLGNPELRERLGNAGRALALADYSWASMAARTMVELRGAVAAGLRG